MSLDCVELKDPPKSSPYRWTVIDTESGKSIGLGIDVEDAWHAAALTLERKLRAIVKLAQD